MTTNFLLYGISRLTSNYGCEAIARGTEKILDRYFPESRCTFVSYRHAKTELMQLGDKSRINVVNSANQATIFIDRVLRKIRFQKPTSKMRIPYRQLAKTNCVLCIGGDLYTFAENESGWEYPWNIVEAGNKIMDMGCPFVIWCASVGPFDCNALQLKKLLEHFQRCTAVIVREPESYQYLKEKLSKSDNIHLAADPAFLMEPVALEESIWRPREKTTVAVNLSAGCIEHVFGANRLSEIRDNYTRLLSRLIGLKNMDILLVPHVSDDHKFLEPVYSTLRNESGISVSILPRNIGSQATKWAISQCDLLLTMRFHCALAGIGTCTPTIILLSTDKGRKLALDIYQGKTQHLLPILGMKETDLLRKIESVLKDRESEQIMLRNRLKVMKERSMKSGEILKQVLDRQKNILSI